MTPMLSFSFLVLKGLHYLIRNINTDSVIPMCNYFLLLTLCTHRIDLISNKKWFTGAMIFLQLFAFVWHFTHCFGIYRLRHVPLFTFSRLRSLIGCWSLTPLKPEFWLVEWKSAGLTSFQCISALYIFSYTEFMWPLISTFLMKNDEIATDLVFHLFNAEPYRNNVLHTSLSSYIYFIGLQGCMNCCNSGRQMQGQW